VKAVETQERHFEGTPVRSWLSFKTHPVSQLAQAWLQSGRGVEVVSEAEFVTARRLGCAASQLLVNGVAKHMWLGKHSTASLRVHFDSQTEIAALLPSALRDGWQVGIRCHVPAERDAHDARFGGQFGLSEVEADEACGTLQAAGLPIQGLHFHLGQAARRPGAYLESLDYLVSVCLSHQLQPRYFDCGGGIDGALDTEDAFGEVAAGFAAATRRVPSLRELWLENGRYLTRESAALTISVVDRKMRADGCYLICDGGRTNHALDADNGPHRLFSLPERGGTQILTTVCGPTCMTDDRLGRVLMSETVQPGDLMVWLDAGAYHLPWETRFSQGLCAVVWADETEQLSLARPRETPEQWASTWSVSQ
jgi:diaminopimelate decarboxylase